jgi:hypothetical protein
MSDLEELIQQSNSFGRFLSGHFQLYIVFFAGLFSGDAELGIEAGDILGSAKCSPARTDDEKTETEAEQEEVVIIITSQIILNI